MLYRATGAEDDLAIKFSVEILVVWWAVRTYRYLYEIPRGLDPRLAAMPENWRADIQTKFEHCLALADAIYATSSLEGLA